MCGTVWTMYGPKRDLLRGKSRKTGKSERGKNVANTHKEVKRKGSRTNRNPATAGKSIMKTQLRVSACQRMGDALDASGNFAYLHVYIFCHVYACIVYVCV